LSSTLKTNSIIDQIGAMVSTPAQRTDCTSTNGLVAPFFGAGPDSNRSAGRHSFVVRDPACAIINGVNLNEALGQIRPQLV